MYRAYKGIGDHYMPIRDGDNKHSADYVIMSATEYDDMRQQQHRLTQDISMAERDRDRYMDRARTARDDAERYLRAEHDRQIADMQRRIDAAEAALVRYKDLADKLQQINRERSNKDRGLQPKATHPGYVPIRSETRTVFYKEQHSTNRKEKSVWHTIVQTPYTVNMPVGDVDTAVRSDVDAGLVVGNDSCWDIQYAADYRQGYWLALIDTDDPYVVADE